MSGNTVVARRAYASVFRLVAVVVLTLALSAVASRPALAVTPSGGTLSGTITDAAGSAITTQDICVEAVATSAFTSPPASTRTDSTGAFQISGLAAGSYRVLAQDCGPARNDQPTYYAVGGSTTSPSTASEVAVTSGSSTTGIAIQMVAGSTIAGAVYGGTGSSTPLSGVCVDAYPQGGSAASSGFTQSGAGGAYTVKHVAPNTTYTVRFDPGCMGPSSGYAPQYYNGQPSSAAANPVSTGASGATGIDAHLATAASISGTISDPAGTPITANVCVAAYSNGEGSRSAMVDGSGQYTIGGLAAGAYTVEAQDCGGTRDDQLTYYGSSGSVNTASAASQVSVGQGATKTGINISMLAGSTISGTVYGGSGTSTKLSGVCVTATGQNGSTGGSAVSASDGTYTVSHLDPAGVEQVLFDASCFGSKTSSYTRQYYNGSSTSANATAVTPGSAGATGIDAHLDAGASISGTIYDPSGAAVTTQDVCASVSSNNGQYYPEATADAQGHYTLSGLAAGTYTVEFLDCGNSSRNDLAVYYGGSTSSTSPSQASPVVLSSGGAQTGIDGHLRAATSISGTVYAGSGTGTTVSGICVYVSGTSPGSGYAFGYATSGANGTYTVRHLDPGQTGYRVEFSDCRANRQYIVQYWQDVDQSQNATPVSPTASQPATGIDAHLRKGGSISGTITDANGKPITSGVCATATSTSGSAGGSSSSLSSSGGYSIPALAAGTYDVRFSDCGPGRNDAPTTVNGVTVTEGQDTGSVNATMQPATSISGHVYQGSGTASPDSGELLAIYPANATSSSNNPQNVVSTDKNGAYSFTGLASGTGYKIGYLENSAGGGIGYYDNASSLDTAKVLTPTVANPITGIDIHLSATSNNPPKTTITGGPAAGVQTSQTDARFSFTADRSGASFTCTLDGVASPCTSPFDTGTLSSGQHTFTVAASAGGVTETSPPSVTWTVNPSAPTATSQGQVPAGGTFSSDPGATLSPSTPLLVNVSPPADAQITLTKEPVTEPAPNGYSLLGRQIDIAAATPSGGSTVIGTPANPFHLAFELDGSQIPAGTDLTTITVTRNGTPAPDCTSTDGSATPDPCVASRAPVSGGGVDLTILTSHCSTWNFAAGSTTSTTTSSSSTTSSATTSSSTTTASSSSSSTTAAPTTATTSVAAVSTPAPSGPPSPGVTLPSAQAVSATVIRSALAAALRAIRGANAALKAIRSHGGFAFAFSAPSAGKLTMVWTVTTVRHHKHVKVTVGQLTAHLAAAGSSHQHLSLTAAGRALVKAARRLTLTATATFASNAGPTVTAFRVVSLHR